MCKIHHFLKILYSAIDLIDYVTGVRNGAISRISLCLKRTARSL